MWHTKAGAVGAKHCQTRFLKKARGGDKLRFRTNIIFLKKGADLFPPSLAHRVSDGESNSPPWP